MRCRCGSSPQRARANSRSCSAPKGDGLTAEAIGAADTVIRIPMAHGIDSLNVAAASAVALWALVQPAPVSTAASLG